MRLKSFIFVYSTVLAILLFQGLLLIPTGSLAEETTQPPPQSSEKALMSAGSSASAAVGGASADNFIFTGAATYSIPIAIPPGRLGMAPAISLLYNSQKGNGKLGVGWELEPGSIQRSTLNGVDYAAKDFVFAKDGATQALVNYSGNEYRLKIEDGGFSKFVYDEASNSWTVYDKTGVVYRLGQTAASRQDDPSVAAQTFQWKLDRIEETNGNYMEFSYAKDQGEIYLDRISYTGFQGSGTSLAPSNSVTFTYEDREDKQPMYSINFAVTTAKRLKQIEVKASDQLVRRYVLNYVYSDDTFRSLLDSVVMYGSDGKSALPPMRFTYQKGERKYEYTDKFLGSGIFGDFNGDGKTDMARETGGSVISCIPSSIKVKLSNGQSFEPPNPTDFGMEWLSDKFCRATLTPVDFNGDGKADLLATTEEYGPDDTTPYYTYKVYYSTGSSFAPSTNHLLPGGDGIDALGDFNGDGKTDILAKGSMILSNGNGFTNAGCWITKTGFFNSTVCGVPGVATASDFNGDGKMDIIVGSPIEDNSSYSSYVVYLSTGKSFVKTLCSVPFNNIESFRDINGDGKPDVIPVEISIGTPSTRKHVYYFTGTGFRDGGYIDDTIYADKIHMAAAPGDFNGDGRGDRIWVDENDTREYGKYAKKYHLNKSPVPDMLSSVSNGLGGTTSIAYRQSSDFENTDLPYTMPVVSSIMFDDGFGNTSERTYEYADGLYLRDEKEFRGFGWVKQTNPDLTTLETWFHQIDGENSDCSGADMTSVHKGKPFLTIMKDRYGNQLSITDLHWEYVGFGASWPVYSRLQSKTSTTTVGVVPVWSSETYTYDDINDNGMVTSVTVSGTDAESVITTNEYRDYGEPTGYRRIWRLKKTTVTGSVSGKVRESTSEYFSATGNLRSQSAWLAGGTVNPSVSYEYYQEGNLRYQYDVMRRTTTYSYDATRTFPVSVEAPATASSDSCGSVYHTVRTEADPRFGAARYTWDENGNKTENVLDAFGRVTYTASYKQNGPIRMAATFFYYSDAKTDAATGRITTPAGVLSRTLALENPCMDDEYIDNWQYFDGLGRGIQSVSRGAGGYIMTSTLYDNMGRVEMVRGPFNRNNYAFYYVDRDTNASPKPWSKTSYDSLGSIKTIEATHDDGNRSLAVFHRSGLRETVIDPDGRKRSSQRDYLGRIIKVTEYVSTSEFYTTTYQYNAAGDMTTTSKERLTDRKVFDTVIRYDSLGRKISMTDPDMGKWMYCYDDAGNLKRQMDAKNQIIEFTYDALNRITNKKYYTTPNPASVTVETASDITHLCRVALNTLAGEYPVTWTYDESSVPNAVGRLTKVSNANATTKVNEYDGLGRTVSVTRTIAGDAASYTTGYGYDYASRLFRITYPGGENFSVYQTYYEGTAILFGVFGSDGVAYASFSAYQPSGAAGLVTYGNGIKTRYSYSQDTLNLKSIVTSATPDDGNYQNDIATRRFDFSGAGNMAKVTDWRRGISYDYLYNPLNWLKSETPATGAPVRLPEAQYGVLPVWTYFPDKAHAVSSITNSLGQYKQFLYDNNGNMTQGWDFASPNAPASRRDITWNADNMPVSVKHTSGSTGASTTTLFAYDGNGARVKKTAASGASTVYVSGALEIISGVKTRYIFANGMRIARVTGMATASIRHYYHKDHLGSTLAITNNTGATVWSSDYEPYGLARNTAGNGISNYRFTDQEYDPETGLYNYNARMYDPAMGRFISPDSIVQNPFSSIGLNRYAYVGNNPLVHIDPSGHFIAEAMMIGAVIGAISFGSPDAAKAFATGFVAGMFITNPILAGMMAGALNGALSGGGIEGIIQGGMMGAAMGYIGGVAAVVGGDKAVYGMMGTGGIMAYKQDGWSGVGNFAVGIAGGMAGASWASSGQDVGGTRGYNKAARNPRNLSRNVNGVEITFDRGANNPIDSVGADQFEDAIRLTKTENPDFDSINISATTNSHPCPSSHCSGYAIDANRVNGIRMAEGYGSNQSVTRIVNSMQTNLSTVGPYYDNLGPFQMNAPYSVSDFLRVQHSNHIHYSWGY